MMEALPSALEMNKTSVLLSTRTDNIATSIDQLPADLTSARKLYMTALLQLYDQFTGVWGITKPNKLSFNPVFFSFLQDA